MNFTNIIIKNLKYNFTKFTSYIFVNMFVISVLFTYGSIVFNKNITEDPILSETMDFVYMGIVAIVLFSVVFISYTGVYFIKTRGKELGVYLTLGMTKNDLIKMMVIENTSIMLVSVIAGMGVGFLFSGVFYLVLSNVLGVESLFYIDGYTFLLSLGVFFVVFITNILFSISYIKTTNIVKITKADKTKGMKTPKKLSGFLGIVLFIGSTTMLYLVFTDKEIVSSLADNATRVIFTNVTLQFVSLYFMLASGLHYLVGVLSKSKKFYNRNILILSNLKYSFYSYKTTLYMITLLTGMSILFMGIQLSFKLGGTQIRNTVLPYDFMIESRGDINNITDEELETIVSNNGGEITDYVTYPYVSTEIYRENETWLFNYGTTTMIMSESNFNNAFGTNFSVEPDELLMVSNGDEDFAEAVIDYDTFLVPDNLVSGEERANLIRQVRPSREQFYEIVGEDNVTCLTYDKEKTSTAFYSFIDSYGEIEFISVTANIIDDEVYNNIINPEITTVKLFNTKGGDDFIVYEELSSTLKTRNNSDVNDLEPICKDLKVEANDKMMSMFSFTMAFISILFLISSSVVMYYKLVNDVEYEKSQVELFKKIGLNNDECKSYLSKHTGIIFFTPLVMGGIIGIFYNYFFFYNAPMRGYLLMVVLVMYFGFVVFDVLFYFIVRRSLIKNVGL